MRCITVCLLLCAGCGFLGCGGEPSAIPVSGSVTLKGQPLDRGYIEFAPMEDAGLLSGAEIKDGQFSIPAGTGLSAGRYQVRITSSEGGAEVNEEAPGESEITATERIPAEFNSASKVEVEVGASTENKFDFAIP